jgi:nucleotide-binding universal stress UspA family protein
VVGSRGYGPIQRALLGSVSEELLARARHPVLVVPRQPSGSA